MRAFYPAEVVRSRVPRRQGFTIVELLIVVVVIAVLAAVALVSYNGITNQAKEAAIKSDIGGATKKIQIKGVEGFSVPSSLADIDFSTDNDDLTFKYAGSRGIFCVTAKSKSLDKVYHATEDGAVKEGYCPLTPESCFVFDAGQNAITGYYQNENNNSENPPCPKNIVIPFDIGGVPVRKLAHTGGAPWIQANGIESIMMSDEMTDVGSAMLYTSASDLYSVSLPESATTFSVDLLRSGVNSLVIPDSVTEITGTLSGTGNFETLVIGDGVTTIPDLAFYQAQGLKRLVLGGSVESVGYGAFRYSPIEHLELPDSLRSIGGLAFENSKVKDLRLPEGLLTVGLAGSTGMGAFNQACNLESVYIPDSVTSISVGSIAGHCAGRSYTVSLPQSLSHLASKPSPATASNWVFGTSDPSFTVRP